MLLNDGNGLCYLPLLQSLCANYTPEAIGSGPQELEAFGVLGWPQVRPSGSYKGKPAPPLPLGFKTIKLGQTQTQLPLENCGWDHPGILLLFTEHLLRVRNWDGLLLLFRQKPL